jgi:hypothetical protein
MPNRYNVDMRYSRKFPIHGTFDAQFTVEVKNLFNTVQWAGVNSTVTTDLLGVPASPIPSDIKAFAPTSGYEQRQVQLGIRVTF